MCKRFNPFAVKPNTLRILIAAATCLPVTARAVIWNGTDPGSSAVSTTGLTDNYDQFSMESLIINYSNSTRGTATFLGNNWVLTARHVVQNGGDYSTLASPSQITVDLFGTYYTGVNIVGFGSSDLALVQLSGTGVIDNLVGVERSQINSNYNENGELVQVGGFGYYGPIGGSESTDVSFHRAFNIAQATGGTINIPASGNSRLITDGYLLGIDDSGDSGSGMWADQGPDQDLDLRDYTLCGITDTSTGDYFGATGGYAQIDGYAPTIISTVYPHAWLTWNANTTSTVASDGPGTWNLTTPHFTDGTNYVFNGPEATQIATFGAGNGSAGTVTLGANITIDGLTFNAAGSGTYTIAGGGYSLYLVPGSTITTNVNATISAPIKGGSSSEYGGRWELIKKGTATLTLTGPTTLDSGVPLRESMGGITISTGGSFSISNSQAGIGWYTGDNATLTVQGTGTFTDTGSPGELDLGYQGGTGTLSVQGSAAVVATSLYIGKGSSGLTGAGGTGAVYQSGGTVIVPQVSLATLHPASGGTYNLSGGALSTASITGGLGTSSFLFNGGQINATASSTAFLQNLTTAGINAGATINTNGYNITVNQPLAHAASAPAIDGGLTKIGNGTLTLGGGSTYTGPTQINAGTLTLNASAGAAAVAVTPVGSYSFDNVSGTTVINGGSGGATMNGTLTGGATIVPSGRFGNAVNLANGASVVVNSPITDTGGAATWTLSAWVHTTTPGAAILDKSDGGWTWDDSVFYLGNGSGTGSGGIPSAVRYGRGFLEAASNTPSVDNGAWHMVTYVDSAGTYSIYTDGALVALSAGNSGFQQTSQAGGTVTFGGTTDAYSGDGTVNFTGLLDEIQIYNIPLTATQIHALYLLDSPNPSATTSVLPGGTPVTLQSSATLNLAGSNQTISTLSGGGYVTLGGGTLTLNGSTGATYSGIISGNGSLIHAGTGTQILGGNDSYSGSTTVTAGTLNLGIGTNQLTHGILVRTLSTVTITNSKLVTGSDTLVTDRDLFVIGGNGLSIGGTTNAWNGTLDLGHNDLDIQNAGSVGLATITNQLREGFANGAWNGSGISSSYAVADTTHLTALGVVLNGSTYGTATGSLGTFDTINPGSQDVLVKFTYYGDANLDGKVDGSDYSLIDSGYLSHATGWFNGDFNYDGIINGSDYTLIDNAFNNQGAQLTSNLANISAQLAAPSAVTPVPEPGLLAITSLIALSLGARQRLKVSAFMPTDKQAGVSHARS